MKLTEGSGFKEMDEMLKSLPRSTAMSVAKRAMKKALAPVEAAARADAPSPREAGAVGVSNKLTKAQARGNPDRDTATVVNMFVGSRSKLAHLFEFGTGPRFQKSGKFTGIMAPRPFMRAAWDGNNAEVLRLLSTELGAEIEKAFARAARKAARKG
ncbi:HK97-gp10 family putative phage morphogenesis protein [Pseudotabrizicola sp. 4114]|uniref:HK97-gp10 family putative phage morphogenesis protein n=1 Tax=Pseudotabrizicola sp. 4114 TaxID=2817731 RepID=UPI002862F3A0|nr:HK97 gp10 family phage protein [Pseudorhodobacter sp. 4114]